MRRTYAARLTGFIAAALVALTATIAPAQAVEFLYSRNVFTGGAWSYTRTNQASAIETVATYGVDTAPTDYLAILNDTTSDAVFIPKIQGFVSSGNSRVLRMQAMGLDTGSNPLMIFDSRTTGNGAIATRPLFSWRNNDANILDLAPLNSGANGVLSWGSQLSASPSAFATRPVGTRLITYSLWNGSNAMDAAIGSANAGATQWYGVGQANSTYAHRFFAGITEVATIRGDGLLYAAQAGGGFGVKEGTNATMGAQALTGGTATVSTTKVTANSRIFLTRRVGAGTRGMLEVGTITAGTSFVINATDSAGALVADTSTVSWLIIEPAP